MAVDATLRKSMADLKKGVTYDESNACYICSVCGRTFEAGEVFNIGSRFFCAEKASQLHVQDAHGDMLDILLAHEKRYTGLTDNQKALLTMIASGLSDQDIARQTGTAAATVRHQRFVFKEKAKQAKLYLAIYELAFDSQKRQDPGGQEDFIDMHGGAKMVDDRYNITKDEEETIISNMFSSLQPLKLKNLSPKEKKKIVILKKIAGQLEKGRKYSEKELNEILENIYDDFATLRRYLIEYGFMGRTKDCREYWLI